MLHDWPKCVGGAYQSWHRLWFLISECLDDLEYVYGSLSPGALHAGCQCTEHGRTDHCITARHNRFNNYEDAPAIMATCGSCICDYLQWTTIGPELFLFCKSTEDVIAPMMARGLVVLPSGFQLNTWNCDTRWA